MSAVAVEVKAKEGCAECGGGCLHGGGNFYAYCDPCTDRYTRKFGCANVSDELLAVVYCDKCWALLDKMYVRCWRDGCACANAEPKANTVPIETAAPAITANMVKCGTAGCRTNLAPRNGFFCVHCMDGPFCSPCMNSVNQYYQRASYCVKCKKGPLCRNCEQAFRRPFGCAFNVSEASNQFIVCDDCWIHPYAGQYPCKKDGCTCANTKPTPKTDSSIVPPNGSETPQLPLALSSSSSSSSSSDDYDENRFLNYRMPCGYYQGNKLKNILNYNLGLPYISWVIGKRKTNPWTNEVRPNDAVVAKCREAFFYARRRARANKSQNKRKAPNRIEGKRVKRKTNTVEPTSSSQLNVTISIANSTSKGAPPPPPPSVPSTNAQTQSNGVGVSEAADDQLRIRPKCKVCWDAPVELAVVACGHYVMCKKCSVALPKKRCPICRVPIDRLITIYEC